MIPIADKAQTATYTSAFAEQGYAHVRAVYSTSQVETFHALYERAVADWQFTASTEDRPDAVSELLERYPREVFPALTHPVLLGFAEAVMGPFVQLDSVVVNSDPPIGPDQHRQPVIWHRDRFGPFPKVCTCARPASYSSGVAGPGS
jgi:hypothetical protein